MNVIELAWLTDEQAEIFGGDFKHCLEWLRHARVGEEYIPEEAEIKHVDELLKLMHVMTGDRGFEEVRNIAPQEKGARKLFKTYYEDLRNKSREEGKAEASHEIMQRLIADGMSQEKAATITAFVRVKPQ